MYELYIANKNYSSWSLRPWVLMRELDIAFTEKLMPFAGGSSFEEFRHFSPTGKVPCLVGGATSVWDSLAIVEYLAERHGGVWPQEANARTWARCATAEMHSGFGVLRERCPMSCGIRVRVDASQPALKRDIDRLTELWSDGLERFGGPFLAGKQFTAVDAFFAPVAFRVQTFGISLAPGAMAYARHLLSLQAMQRWYADALIESWREPVHEADTRAAGTWLEDLRREP